MQFKDCCAISGLAVTATTEEIKKVYRKLAHQYHSDVSKDFADEANLSCTPYSAFTF